MHPVKVRHNGQFIALEFQHPRPSNQPHPHPPEKDLDIAECIMPMPSFTKSMLSAIAAAASIHHTLGSTWYTRLPTNSTRLSRAHAKEQVASQASTSECSFFASRRFTSQRPVSSTRLTLDMASANVAVSGHSCLISAAILPAVAAHARSTSSAPTARTAARSRLMSSALQEIQWFRNACLRA